ncbi:branched-chain amino acid ABC transporter permease [Methyloversatilis thermotolerans]|uniref:branched-chain amino acid ABC transporter permease n=1 Tax=Methyloversatilis thermotolerans TaxID=1346290 RepID=UPI0003627186|nr:branched-chain amino acid ABC transporter permease [Methyloversatilis thermotolerans]
MLYREAGQFHTSYTSDRQLFPLKQDRIGMVIMLLVAFVAIPLLSSDYWLSAILIPWLILALVALGQNILMGYAGQLSLGSAGFMAAGAFACYNLILRVPDIPFLLAVLLSGLIAACIGILFGLPSLRIRGLYLAVATLASQFFIVWALDKFGWFKNYDPAGVISAQQIVMFGHTFASPAEKYLVVLSIVAVLTLLAKNMARGSTGRAWRAVRDMDVAAEVMGLSLLRTKLQAFAISSFYCGVGGALFAFAYLQTVEPSAFNIELSFRILFMVIIGGIGTILGSFLGAGFILLMPVFLNILFHAVAGHAVDATILSALEQIIFGALIIIFLIVEPLGLARIWQLAKERLRLWPFPH